MLCNWCESGNVILKLQSKLNITPLLKTTQITHSPNVFPTGKEYRVVVKTGKKSDAGTSAGVYVKFFGDKGKSGELPLVPQSRSANPFQMGKEDLFMVKATDVGHIQKIRVWHDNEGMEYFVLYSYVAGIILTYYFIFFAAQPLYFSACRLTD